MAHLVCCTSGDAGGDDADADPLELAALREAEQRAAASIVGYEGVTLPAPAGRRAGQRPGPARAARPRHPHLPARRGGRARPASHRPRGRLHPARRPSRGRRRGARCRLSGGAQRHGLPAPRHGRGPGAPRGRAPLPLLVGAAQRLRRHQRHARSQARGAPRPRQPAPPARGARRAHPRLGSEAPARRSASTAAEAFTVIDLG